MMPQKTGNNLIEHNRRENVCIQLWSVKRFFFFIWKSNKKKRDSSWLHVAQYKAGRKTSATLTRNSASYNFLLVKWILIHSPHQRCKYIKDEIGCGHLDALHCGCLWKLQGWGRHFATFSFSVKVSGWSLVVPFSHYHKYLFILTLKILLPNV